MQIEVSASDIKSARKADDRGRVTLGSEYAASTVTVAVLSVEDEDDQVIVVADHTGHELSEWVSDFNLTEVDCDAFYAWNHEVARELTDRGWAVVDPVVFDKLGKATRHAEEEH